MTYLGNLKKMCFWYLVVFINGKINIVLSLLNIKNIYRLML